MFVLRRIGASVTHHYRRRGGLGEAAPGAVVHSAAMSGDAAGYFPRGRSLLRRVHDERIVGLRYGQRALLMGGLDPVVSAGAFETSRGGAAPFDRLVRTAKTFETIFTGSRAEADRELERVRNLHEGVMG